MAFKKIVIGLQYLASSCIDVYNVFHALFQSNYYGYEYMVYESTGIITNTVARRMHHPTWTGARVFDKNRHALTLLRDDLTLTRIRNTVAPTYRCACTVTHCALGYPFPALLLKHNRHGSHITNAKRSSYIYPSPKHAIHNNSKSIQIISLIISTYFITQS